MKRIKLKSQPKWVVRTFILMGALLGGIFAFVGHPIGGTNAQTPTTATLSPGIEFVAKIKTLAGGHSSSYAYVDTNIEYIIRTGAVDMTKTTTGISASDSEYPITAWYDSSKKTIYYYTEADEIYMNVDSSCMFSYMRGLKEFDFLNSWNTSRVTNMSYMFQLIAINGDLNLGNLDTSRVTKMYEMFYKATISGDLMGLSNWDVSNVMNMYFMFGSATISGDLDLSGWILSATIQAEGILSNAKIYGNLINPTITRTRLLPGQQFAGKIKTLAKGYSANYYDSNSNIEYIVRTGAIDSSKITTGISDTLSEYPITAWYDSSKKTIYYYSEADNIYMYPNSEQMFYKMNGLKELDLNSWDTSSLIDMYGMFNQATINGDLNLSNIDTSNVNRIMYMFGSATIKGDLNLSNWDTSSVTNMSYMFSSAKISGELIGLSDWDTSSVTNMSFMFNNAQISGELMGLSDWDTSSVTDMSYMFSSAKISGDSIGLSNWNTSNVMNMYYTFRLATISGDLNLSNWDTSSVTNMSKMFDGATISGDLNLSNWDTSSVTNMSYMFNNAKITTIYVISGFDTSKVTSQSGLFTDSEVVGGNGTVCNTALNKSYLRIDRPGEPGCFWDIATANPHGGHNAGGDEYGLVIPTTQNYEVAVGGDTYYDELPSNMIVTTNNVQQINNEPVLGEVDVDFWGNNATFNRLMQVKIPVSESNYVYVKVKHGGSSEYNFDGLTINRNASCNNGRVVANGDKYNGETISVVDGYASIYTCEASSFIALGVENEGDSEIIVNIAKFNDGQNTCSGSNYIFENIVAGTSTGTHTLSGVFQCAFGNGRSSSTVTLQLSGDLVADGDRVISGSNLMMKNSEWTVSPVGLKFADTLISTWRALTAT